MKTRKNKFFQMPDVYVLLFFLICFAALLTWLVPAGSFDRVKDGKMTKVVAGSFHYSSQNPQHLWHVFQALMQGFINQARLIFMIFFVGAAVKILEAGKAINVAFAALAKRMKGKEALAIFVVMLLMSIGGATGVLGNVTLVLIPVGIYLSQAMGMDKTLGFFIIFFGSFSGFNVGWANPGVVGLAQSIAELPMFSGYLVRMGFHVVNFLLCFAFVLRYFKQVKKDPTESLNYELGMSPKDYLGPTGDEEIGNNDLSKRQMAVLILVALAMLAVMVGAIVYKWGPNEIASLFLAVSFLTGLIYGFGLDGTAKAFVQGCQALVPAAFIVGFANAVTVILNQGGILDTIVNALSLPIESMGPVLGANMMLLANILINFFISSGSGQATTVMPIMTPIADVTGISRQVAVQSFQFGDGFTNCLVPTVGTLMGGLGFAGISYGKYFRKVFPLIALQLLLSFVAITVLQSLGWTGV